MRHLHFRNRETDNSEAVSNLLANIMITSVLMILFVAVILTTNVVFIEGPSDNLKYHHYIDIGNGVSTRIVDLYIIAPKDEHGRRTGNMLNPVKTGTSQQIIVTDGSLSSNVASNIAIAGIGETLPVMGNTSGNNLKVDFKERYNCIVRMMKAAYLRQLDLCCSLLSR